MPQEWEECLDVHLSIVISYLLTYAHHFRWSIGHQRPPAIALFWAALVIPDQLVPCCFSFASVSPPTVARPASLSLPLWVPGQGLVCGAGCWLPEDVSDPAPLPPQYLLGHWFLSRSLPQVFISDLLLPIVVSCCDAIMPQSFECPIMYCEYLAFF